MRNWIAGLLTVTFIGFLVAIHVRHGRKKNDFVTALPWIGGLKFAINCIQMAWCGDWPMRWYLVGFVTTLALLAEALFG